MLRERKLGALCVLLSLWAYGCGDKGKAEGEGTTAAREAEKLVELEPRSCGGEGRSVDVNNDGTPDLKHSYEGDRRVCSALDMNFDGNADVLRFYADDGTSTEFEQHDFDFDGRLDEQAFFENGKIVRRELDTNFDTVVDTWLWCNGPLVTRAERARRRKGRIDTWEQYDEQGMLHTAEYDTNNDGRVDKWETFEQGRLTEIQRDTDGDGEPDRTEAVPDQIAGQAEKRYSCNGNPLPEMKTETAPASPPMDSDTDFSSEDETSDDTEAQDAEPEEGAAADGEQQDWEQQEEGEEP